MGHRSISAPGPCLVAIPFAFRDLFLAAIRAFFQVQSRVAIQFDPDRSLAGTPSVSPVQFLAATRFRYPFPFLVNLRTAVLGIAVS